ncbi:hypothetical protein M5F04_04220 [Acinetobacter sp. ANC 7200]|uniref:hypothetical protein n=1 Tax=Acinetobacter amyesii TaxID=2942470 RepID=UPI0020BE0ED6|nr:hypothetical protein [Acinetobacter amyesii]MCL6243779.1 hypothetical protein [Acinetobacter amyesii]
MDIQEKQAKWNQERPLFEAEFIHSHLLPFFNFNENTGDYEIKSEYENDEDRALSFNVLNTGWAMWLRAKRDAKAQAVPEGFVLVKKVHPDAIVHNQGLGLFKECQVIYGWDGKSKDFKDALNKGFYHGVKLGAKAVLETAMIKAQEPAND